MVNKKYGQKYKFASGCTMYIFVINKIQELQINGKWRV